MLLKKAFQFEIKFFALEMSARTFSLFAFCTMFIYISKEISLLFKECFTGKAPSTVEHSKGQYLVRKKLRERYQSNW
jgi:hypothetical protein